MLGSQVSTAQTGTLLPSINSSYFCQSSSKIRIAGGKTKKVRIFHENFTYFRCNFCEFSEHFLAFLFYGHILYINSQKLPWIFVGISTYVKCTGHPSVDKWRHRCSGRLRQHEQKTQIFLLVKRNIARLRRCFCRAFHHRKTRLPNGVSRSMNRIFPENSYCTDYNQTSHIRQLISTEFRWILWNFTLVFVFLSVHQLRSETMTSRDCTKLSRRKRWDIFLGIYNASFFRNFARNR